MKTSFVHLWWFLTTINYFACPSEAPPTKTRLPPTKQEINSSVTWNRYCRNSEDPQDVEMLLDIDAEVTMAIPNWWRHKNFILYFIKQESNPRCSIPPNSHSSLKKISDYQYFQSRGIDIPLKSGQKVTQTNVFEHVERKPVKRIMLMCGCQILDSGDKDKNPRDICVKGSTVALSKGVGGKKSFFVHVPTSSGAYKVVAHICGR